MGLVVYSSKPPTKQPCSRAPLLPVPWSEREWTSSRGPWERVCTRNGPVNSRSPGFFSSVRSPAEKAFERELFHLQQSVTSGNTQSIFSSKFSERSPRTRESWETREAIAAAREEKEETALTARANEIRVNVVLATQKYDRLMLIITIIIIVVVFVAPLTLLVGWAGVQGVYLDGLKKWSLV